MTKTTRLTPQQVAEIKARLAAGEYQHRIAADYDINQGRVSEIATGKRFSTVRPQKSETNYV